MSAEARELELYADNESSLYPQKQAIQKNLVLKKVKGTYESSKAAKLWMYWVEAAAKRYAKENFVAGAWHTMFPKSTREQVARACVVEFESDYKNGELDRFKPAKKAAKAKRR